MGIVAGDLLFKWTPTQTRRADDEWGSQTAKETIGLRRCRNVRSPDCDGYLRVTDRWEKGTTEHIRYVCTECHAITRETVDNHISKGIVYIQK